MTDSDVNSSEAAPSADTFCDVHANGALPRRTMTKTTRIYKIEMHVRNRGHLTLKPLLDELEGSPATLKRDLAYPIDQPGVSTEYDRLPNGCLFGEDFRGERHEFPDLWFNDRQLHSLLVAHLRGLRVSIESCLQLCLSPESMAINAD